MYIVKKIATTIKVFYKYNQQKFYIILITSRLIKIKIKIHRIR